MIAGTFAGVLACRKMLDCVPTSVIEVNTSQVATGESQHASSTFNLRHPISERNCMYSDYGNDREWIKQRSALTNSRFTLSSLQVSRSSRLLQREG